MTTQGIFVGVGIWEGDGVGCGKTQCALPIDPTQTIEEGHGLHRLEMEVNVQIVPPIQQNRPLTGVCLRVGIGVGVGTGLSVAVGVRLYMRLSSPIQSESELYSPVTD